MKAKRILFVINLKSGASENTEVEEGIRKKIADTHPFEIFILEGEDITGRLKERVDTFKPEIVAAAGGDGTVNLVASIISGSEISLGIIPLGSANGLAYELGIPAKLNDALDVIMSVEPKPFDLVRINEHHISLHLSDVGINARIIREFEKEGKRGLSAYFRHFLKEMFKRQSSFHCTVLANGRIQTFKAYMTLIANCNRYGTGAVINPSGRWDDGQFEVVVIRQHRRWIFRSLIGAFTGTFHLQPHIEVLKCTTAVISTMPAQELQVDGEVLGRQSEIRAIIEPHALNVISGNQSSKL